MKPLKFAALSWAALVLAVAAIAPKAPGFPKSRAERRPGSANAFARQERKTGTAPISIPQSRSRTPGKNTAFIMFYGEPSAIDNAGVKFDRFKSLSGVAYCTTNPSGLCVGLPRLDEHNLFPLRGYTEIDPGKSVTLAPDPFNKCFRQQRGSNLGNCSNGLPSGGRYG